MMRKQYTSAFKAKVVQELLKEEKTLAQLASEYEMNSTRNIRFMAHGKLKRNCGEKAS